MTDQQTDNSETSQKEKFVEQIAPPPVEQPSPGNGPKKLTVGYLDVVIIAVLAAVVTVLVYNRYFAQDVVMVDLTGYIKQQRTLFTEGRIDKARVSANLDRFQKFIDSQPKNVMVLTKDVVLAGGREIRPPGVASTPANRTAKNTENK